MATEYADTEASRRAQEIADAAGDVLMYIERAHREYVAFMDRFGDSGNLAVDEVEQQARTFHEI